MSRCIWYISKYLTPPGAGSAGARGFLLMKELSIIGDRIVMITSDSNQHAKAPVMNSPYLYQAIDGMDLWWVRTFKYQVAKSTRRILSWIHFEWRLLMMPKKHLPKPDAIIVSSLSLLTILNGLWLSRRYRCRLILEVRDIWPLTLITDGGFNPNNPFIKLLAFIEWLGYKHADAIVGTMPNLAEHVSNVLGYTRNVACVPMGFSQIETCNDQPLFPEYARVHIPHDKFIVAYVGSIGIANELDTLLSCATQLIAHPKIHFLLVGDGDLRSELKSRFGHLPNVSFAPKVPKEMVQSVLSSCDLLYFCGLSKRWNYGQSLNKIIDYMISGKPIVASYTGFPSMINEANCGRFVASDNPQELNDEILRLASMPPKILQAMGQRGRQWILKYRSFDTLARHYRTIIFPQSSNTMDTSKRCVWYVSKYVSPPGLGSAGGRGYLLMKELARLGIHPVIITSDSNHLSEVPQLDRPYFYQSLDGMDLWWVRTFKYQVAKSSRRILSWLHFEWRLLLMPRNDLPRPDVVIVSSLSLLTILNGFLLRSRYGCRLVFEIRDIWPLTLTEEGGFTPGNPLIKLLAFVERLGYRHSDLIVGTMPNLADHVAQVLEDHRPVCCVPMGFDPSSIGQSLPLPTGYQHEYIPKGKFIVAHVGSIGITNALDTLLECATQLVENSRIHFLFVGDGDLKADYQKRFGHLPNITFVSRVRKEMVPSVLQQCDLLYFSAHVSKVWLYGQSLNKVIDYMLSGKPILASYTGYPSMINEAECGFFVPSGDVHALKDAILRMSEMDSDALTNMGLRGRQWIFAHRKYEKLAMEYYSLLFSPDSTLPEVNAKNNATS